MMTVQSMSALLSIFAGGVLAASGPAPPAAEVPSVDRIAPPPPGERAFHYCDWRKPCPLCGLTRMNINPPDFKTSYGLTLKLRR